MLARGVDVLATYAFYTVAARSLAVADFGRFVVGITILQTVATGCLFGLDQALLTIPPSGAANRLAVRIVVAASLAVAVLAATGWCVSSLPLAGVAFWFCAALPPAAVGQFVFGALRARNAMTAAAIAEGFVQPVSALIFAAAAVLYGPSLVTLTQAFVLSWVVTLPFALRVGWAGMTMVREAASRLRATGRSMLGVAFLQQAAGSADVLLLGLFVSAADVGRYAAALKVSAAFILLHGAITTAVTPFMRALSADGRQLTEYHRIVTRWMFAAALPFLVVTTGVPALVLRLFGRAYVHGNETVLVLLSIAAIIVVLSGPAGSVLLCSGHAHTLFRVTTFGAVSLVASVALLARFGAIGAAAGLLLGRIITRGSLLIALRRVLDKPAFDLPLLLMAGGGMAGVILTRMTAGSLGAIPAVALGCTVVLAAAMTIMMRQGDVAVLRSEFRGE